MRHLAAVSQPLHAAVVENKMTVDDAIDSAYHYGYFPKEGMNVDSVVSELAERKAQSESPKLHKSEHHCAPLKAMAKDGSIDHDKAIEAAFKLGAEEKVSVIAAASESSEAVYSEPAPQPDQPDQPDQPEDLDPQESRTVIKRRGKKSSV